MRRRAAVSVLALAALNACTPKPIELAERSAASDADQTFDVAAAQAAGHSSDAIEAYLSRTRRFDLKKARKVGFSQDQIIQFLAKRPPVEDGTTPDPASRTFRHSGFACSSDCSGHQAGYDWAQRRSITSPADCSGNSQSFIEGCLTFVNESR